MTGLLQALETLFRRRFWIPSLAMMTIVALVFAAALAQIVGGLMAPHAVTQPHLGENMPPTDDAPGSALSVASLLQSDESPLPIQITESDVADEPVEPAVFAEGDCAQVGIEAMLVGTNTHDSAFWSFATVQDRTTNRTEVVREGAEIAGAVVLAVERDRIWVRYHGEEVCLKAGVEPVAVAVNSRPDNDNNFSRSGAPTSHAAPQERPSSRQTTSLRDGIRALSPTQFEIQRDTINQALASPRELQAQAPAFEMATDDGRPSGIRLTDIPTGSIFRSIGLRRGDVIQEVNGRRVSTPQRAMALYEALQNESQVEVVVLRRGRQRTLLYTIQ